MSIYNDLFSSLQKLDQLLSQAVSTAQATYGVEMGKDPYRGLYVNQEDFERNLNREPGSSLFSTVDGSERIITTANLLWLEKAFKLSAFDSNIILIALAPEIDLRYERLYAYLQDDINRKRPTVDLVLNLLCTSAANKLKRREHFSPDAPLIHHKLIHLISDGNHIQASLLAHFIKLDEQIIRLLLEQPALDERLKSFTQIYQPLTNLEQIPHNNQQQALKNLIVHSQQNNQPVKLHFWGVSEASKLETAQALATDLNIPLISCDLQQAINLKIDLELNIPVLFREAQFHNAILYLTGLDGQLEQSQTSLYQQLFTALTAQQGVIILASKEQKLPHSLAKVNAISVNFPLLDFSDRRIFWQEYLSQAKIELNSTQLDNLANNFKLTQDQIYRAVTVAQNYALWRGATQNNNQSIEPVTINDLFTSARSQSGEELRALAQKIEPKYIWTDIILPEDQLRQLREVCNQAKYRYIVYDHWGFAQKLSLGKGLNVLFSGSPGTGKTMAAEVVANELKLDIYKIDLSQIVSKYIGETEKNLDRIFKAAQTSNAMLFFDEADALFGKRSDVKDAHDRYANIEIGYLLQKMEEHEGITILATNLRQNLDEAFIRRLQFIIEFPFPDQEHRKRIWEGIFPTSVTLSVDVDFNLLASEIQIPGGNIKNIAIAAAFYAVEDGNAVQMKHLIQAAQREYQKLGRTWQDIDLNQG
jgi:hypothetical protein